MKGVAVPSVDQPVDVGAEAGGSLGALLTYVPFAFVVGVAAVTRFVFLGHQSLWYDEIVSLTLAKQPFGAMLRGIARTESTPPLYYVLLWVWVRVFGTSVDALRSLSACFGILTVAVLYLAARVRFSRGAALVSGALAATNPMLIWYSQETRAYALAVFFVACSLYFLLRAPRAGAAGLVGWSVAACLALASHYFAAFVLVPEAGYLLYVYRERVRNALLALAGPLAVGGLLLPLAIRQRNSGHAAYIGRHPLASRIEETLNQYLLGRWGIPGSHVLLLSLLVALLAAVSIARWGTPAAKRNALLLAVLALAAFVLPLFVAAGYFRDRNMIVVLPLLLLLAGVAFVPGRTRSLPRGAGLAAAALLLVPTVLTATRLDLQREDWRGLASLIGQPNPSRAVLVYPHAEYIALTHYKPDLAPIAGGTLHVRELVLVGSAAYDTRRPPAGFHRIQDKRLGVLRIIRLQSGTPRTVNVSALSLHPSLRTVQQSHDAPPIAAILTDRDHDGLQALAAERLKVSDS